MTHRKKLSISVLLRFTIYNQRTAGAVLVRAITSNKEVS